MINSQAKKERKKKKKKKKLAPTLLWIQKMGLKSFRVWVLGFSGAVDLPGLRSGHESGDGGEWRRSEGREGRGRDEAAVAAQGEETGGQSRAHCAARRWTQEGVGFHSLARLCTFRGGQEGYSRPHVPHFEMSASHNVLYVIRRLSYIRFHISLLVMRCISEIGNLLLENRSWCGERGF